MEAKSQLGCQAHRPQQPQRVFGKSLVGDANGANQPGAQVGAPAIQVHNPARLQVARHGVDSEVPPRQVLGERYAVLHLWLARAALILFATKGCNLDVPAREDQTNRSELLTYAMHGIGLHVACQPAHGSR